MFDFNAEKVILVALKLLTIIATLGGNTMVIVVVFWYRPLRQVQNYLLVSLACTDFLVAVTILPLNIIDQLRNNEWIFGIRLCDFWLTSDIMFCTASILHLCVIAIDRYRAVRFPMTYARNRSLSSVCISLLIVYVLSALISVPPVFGWRTSPISYLNSRNETVLNCTLTDKADYVIYSACGSFFLPCLVMLLVYTNICRITQRRKRRRTQNGNTKCAIRRSGASPFEGEDKPGEARETIEMYHEISCTHMHFGEEGACDDMDDDLCESSVNKDDGKETSAMYDDDAEYTTTLQNSPGKNPIANSSKEKSIQQSRRNRQRLRIQRTLSREQRAVRTVAVVMVTFVLCWLPFFIIYLLPPLCKCMNVSRGVRELVTWLGYLNSALNPVIYTVFNYDFRNAFKKFFTSNPSTSSSATTKCSTV